MRWKSTLAAAILLTLSSPSSAAVRPWLSGTVGGSGYAMGNVNDDIAFINALLPSGMSMDVHVTGGFSFGLAAGLDVGGGLAVGVGYDRLLWITGSGLIVPVDLNLDANLIRAFGRLGFVSAGPATGFIEASLGQVSPAGGVTLNTTGPGAGAGDFEGSGFAFEGCGGLDLWTGNILAVTVSAGYRHAVVGDVKIEGTPIYTANGDEYTIDYSGVFVRAGLRVALMP